MAKEEFVLTLPLKVEKWQADILDKRYELLRLVYNMVQQKLVRQYIYFSQQKAYRDCKNFEQRREFFETHPFHIKGVKGKNGELCDIKFPYTYRSRGGASGKRAPNGISDYVSKLWSHRIGQGKTLAVFGINSYILEELGLHIMKAWEDRLYKPKSKRVSFKDYGEINSFGSRNKKGNFAGFTIDLEKGHITYKYKKSNEKAKRAAFIQLPIDFSREKNGYAREALKGGTESLKKLLIVRRCIRGVNKYCLQLTISGEKPQKGRTLGKGNVGIDVGPSTIATSSLKGVHFDKLADKCDNIEHELYLINRKLDRSRRANNPQNYNEDGKIKRGIRLVWKKDKDVKRYATLKQQRKELYRKQAEIRKQQHLEMANAMLSQGDTFIVENNPVDAWVRRAKETTKTKTGKNRCKKRYGKSVANHAPSMFVSILKNKVLSLGGKFYEIDPRNAATQFDFTNGEFTKHEVRERSITLSNGCTHQRDMLSAFNLQHIVLQSKELKEYDIEQMNADYPIFCRLESAEQERFRIARCKERDALYFVGAFKKQMRRQPQEESVANRHNGGVGRKYCNTSLVNENAKITGSGLARESIERVSQVPDECHPFGCDPIVLDGL